MSLGDAGHVRGLQEAGTLGIEHMALLLPWMHGWRHRNNGKIADCDFRRR
jgi:hypothetical protein